MEETKLSKDAKFALTQMEKYFYRNGITQYKEKIDIFRKIFKFKCYELYSFEKKLVRKIYLNIINDICWYGLKEKYIDLLCDSYERFAHCGIYNFTLNCACVKCLKVLKCHPTINTEISVYDEKCNCAHCLYITMCDTNNTIIRDNEEVICDYIKSIKHKNIEFTVENISRILIEKNVVLKTYGLDEDFIYYNCYDLIYDEIHTIG